VTRFVLELEPRPADDPGVEANSRLTASAGIVLTVLLLVEGFTILDVRGYLTLHTFLGLMLVGPIALKCATTTYRFARYYRHAAPYRRRGAPPLVLRVIGPLVLLSSLAVIGTGIALLVERDGSDTWLTLHQASFIVWISVTGLHFLGHIYEAVLASARDVRAASSDRFVRGRLLRLGIVALSLAVGVALAAAFTPAPSWWHAHGGVKFSHHH
jgi:hypothetical protein